MINEGSKKRILILTADVGFGHRSAANAVAAALLERYSESCQVEVVNPLDDKRTPALLRDTQTDYDKLVKRMPESYKVTYHISNEPVTNAIVEQTLTLLLFNALSEILKRTQPHVVVVTNSIYLAPLKSVLAIHRLTIPYQTVITDLTEVHRQWFNDGADDVFVPTPSIRAMLEIRLQNRSHSFNGNPSKCCHCPRNSFPEGHPGGTRLGSG
jgi:1,2-diacylglycerol 3-beta-galactosyltransferase